MAALATVAQLSERLGYELDTADSAQATAALDDASAVVCTYGIPWTAETVPDVVRAVVLAAAERRMRNPEGYRFEMEGSYQYQRQAGPAGVQLSRDEKAIVRHAAGLGGITSVPMVR